MALPDILQFDFGKSFWKIEVGSYPILYPSLSVHPLKGDLVALPIEKDMESFALPLESGWLGDLLWPTEATELTVCQLSPQETSFIFTTSLGIPLLASEKA